MGLRNPNKQTQANKVNSSNDYKCWGWEEETESCMDLNFSTFEWYVTKKGSVCEMASWTDVCTPFSTLKCVEKYFAHIPPSLHHLPLSFKLAVPIPFLYVFLHISCSWPVRLVHSWAALGVAKLSTNGQPPLTTFCNECKRPIIEVAELWSLIVAVFDLLVNEKNIRWWRRVNHFEIDTITNVDIFREEASASMLDTSRTSGRTSVLDARRKLV